MCSACFHALAVVFLANHYSAAHYEFLPRSDTQRPLRVVMIRRVTIAGGTVPFEQGHEVLAKHAAISILVTGSRYFHLGMHLHTYLSAAAVDDQSPESKTNTG